MISEREVITDTTSVGANLKAYFGSNKVFAIRQREGSSDNPLVPATFDDLSKRRYDCLSAANVKKGYVRQCGTSPGLKTSGAGY